jgi:hypothetical protein
LKVPRLQKTTARRVTQYSFIEGVDYAKASHVT